MKLALDKVISFQLDHPIRILFIIAVITVGSMLVSTRVQFDFTVENLFPDNDPEVDAYFKFQEEFEREDNLIYLAYDSEDPFSRSNLLTTNLLTNELNDLKGVVKVTSLTNIELFQPGKDLVLRPVYKTIPTSKDSLFFLKNRIMSSPLIIDNLISSDGSIAAILLELDDEINNHDGREKIVNKVGEITSKTDWKWYEAGVPILRTRYVQYMLNDFTRFLFPVSFVLFGTLFLLFRNLSGVLLPFAAVFITVLWVLGIMGALGLTINIVTYIVPTLVLIIGVADSIHIMLKFQENLLNGNSKRESIRITIRKIGGAIMLTSITTAIGFLSLVSTNIIMIRQFGAIVCVSVILAFFVSITFIPSMLMILKTPSQKMLKSGSKNLRHRFLKWTVKLNNYHQKSIVFLSLILICTFLYYAFKVDPHSSLMEDLSKGNELYDDMIFMEQKMGSVMPLEVIATVNNKGAPFENGIKDPKTLHAIAKLQDKLSTIPEVGKMISVIDYLREINQAFNEGDKEFYCIPETREMVSQYIFLQEEQFETLVNFDYSSARLTGRISDISSRRAKEIKDEIIQWGRENLPSYLDIQLTGTTLMGLKINQYLVTNLVVSFLIAFGVIFISMLLLFKSVKIASISMIPNFIPLLLMAGVMGFYNIKLRPTTAMTFAIAYGIAVDDTIHFLVRFRQELFSHNGHYREANEKTLLTTGKAIISTSFILSAGFLVMVTSNFLPSRDFGFLAAVTMFGALLADLFFLPAILTLTKPKMPHLKSSSHI
ncbi:MAG: RND family transporter [Candidatus Neomarinimicrobiota bacterium]